MTNRYLPSLVCGFGAAVFTTVPGIKNVACCLLVPLAALIALYLHKKTNKDEPKISTGIGLMLGLLTGIFAAVFASFFDIIMTLLTRTNDFITSLPQSKEMISGLNLGSLVEESFKMMESMASDIKSTGFSVLYTFMITISNLLTFGIFGFLGGALGLALINKRKS